MAEVFKMLKGIVRVVNTVPVDTAPDLRQGKQKLQIKLKRSQRVIPKKKKKHYFRKM